MMTVCIALLTFTVANPVWAQAKGHASVGLGHGEEGYLHLEEMIKHLEFSLTMPDADPELKTHGAVALKKAKEALKSYDEALKHASESFGRAYKNPMGEDGSHSHEGSDEGPPASQKRGAPRGEGSQH